MSTQSKTQQAGLYLIVSYKDEMYLCKMALNKQYTKASSDIMSQFFTYDDIGMS